MKMKEIVFRFEWNHFYKETACLKLSKPVCLKTTLLFHGLKIQENISISNLLKKDFLKRADTRQTNAIVTRVTALRIDTCQQWHTSSRETCVINPYFKRSSSVSLLVSPVPQFRAKSRVLGKLPSLPYLQGTDEGSEEQPEQKSCSGHSQRPAKPP